MAKPHCADCRFRAKYDADSQSLLGRIWRWHASWCPGWKAYLLSLPEEERAALTDRYAPGRKSSV
ncbi:MAG: hypothetical protein P4L42_00145 [Desulfocapsaceae bacterium]|nr:hypothetical protein [Desulfocapsaceae bacterium]